MPRPKKCRKVCRLPESMEFIPVNPADSGCVVIMTVDEYETIRLIDKEGFSQEECGEYMKIARTTVQQIYNRARHKVACALVDGLPLKIMGGDYQLCDGNEHFCGCGGCRRHREARELQENHGQSLGISPMTESIMSEKSGNDRDII